MHLGAFVASGQGSPALSYPVTGEALLERLVSAPHNRRACAASTKTVQPCMDLGMRHEHAFVGQAPQRPRKIGHSRVAGFQNAPQTFSLKCLTRHLQCTYRLRFSRSSQQPLFHA